MPGLLQRRDQDHAVLQSDSVDTGPDHGDPRLRVSLAVVRWVVDDDSVYLASPARSAVSSSVRNRRSHVLTVPSGTPNSSAALRAESPSMSQSRKASDTLLGMAAATVESAASN